MMWNSLREGGATEPRSLDEARNLLPSSSLLFPSCSRFTESTRRVVEKWRYAVARAEWFRGSPNRNATQKVTSVRIWFWEFVCCGVFGRKIGDQRLPNCSLIVERCHLIHLAARRAGM